VPAPEKPPLLYILAALALLLGSFGTLFTVSRAVPLLLSRDQFVSEVRHSAERLPLNVNDVAEKEADVVYSRRGVALPLAAMNLILSVLLFLGAGRAMRGSPWGLSAWHVAATANIPYTILATVFSLVQTRELRAVMPDVAADAVAGVLSTGAIFWGGLEVLYFAACVLYLRRASIRSLFLRPPAA